MRHSPLRLAAMVLGLLALAPAPEAAAGGGATVTVTPAAGLTDGQTIELGGTASTDLIETHLCRADLTSIEDCGREEEGVAEVVGGAWRLEFVAYRFQTIAYEEYDCTLGCVVAAFDARDLTRPLLATAPVTFDPDEPVPPRPRLHVSPSRGLLDGARVTIMGSRFEPGTELTLVQCVDLRCYEGFRDVIAGPSGRFRIRTRLDRLVYDYAQNRYVDCAEAERSCILVVSPGGAGQRRPRPVSLRFRDVPLPKPVISVGPNRKLVDGQVVDVVVTNPGPGGLVLCRTGAVTPSDGCVGLAEAPATPSQANTSDRSPTLRTSVVLQRLIGTYGPDGPEAIDCAAVRGACSLVWLRDPDILASVRLRFDTSVPAPTATLAITPNADLVDQTEVTIQADGLGLAPIVWQCPPGTATPDFRRCDYLAGGAEDRGPVAPLTATVPRFLARSGRRIDCANTTRRCRAIAVGNNGLIVGEPLNFAPAEPVVEPELTVAATEPLADLAPLTISVSPAERPWRLLQCRLDNGTPRSCERRAVFDLDGDPAEVTAVTYPSRYLRRGGDCTIATCVLVLVADGRFQVDKARLSFDPDGAPPPPPTLQVRPRNDLADGDELDIIVHPWRPGRLLQCVNEGVADSGCRYVGRVLVGRPGAPVRTTIRVERLIAAIDCGERPGRCEVRFTTDRPEDTVVVPLAFDPSVSRAPEES